HANKLSGSTPGTSNVASALSSDPQPLLKDCLGTIGPRRRAHLPAGQPALHRLFKRRDGSFAKEMSTEPDIRSWPASQRSEHYQELATKLRRIAEAEKKVPELRAQILALARQYQELVTG